MTDIEKRAHDLSVAYAQAQIIKDFLNPEIDSSQDTDYSMFEIYEESYPMFQHYLEEE